MSDYVFLRIFRCLCFSLLLPYNAYKLDHRSTSYVFLGYNSSQLGYRCLDLSYNHIYISRHVGFHEHVFPFNEFAHSPAYITISPSSLFTNISSLPFLTIFPTQIASATPPLPNNPSVPSPSSPSISLDYFYKFKLCGANIISVKFSLCCCVSSFAARFCFPIWELCFVTARTKLMCGSFHIFSSTTKLH